MERICELSGSPQQQDLVLIGGGRRPCHFGWAAPLIWRCHPYLMLIFSSPRLKGTWIINKLVESRRAIIACVINPEPMWFGELIKLLLLGWKFLLPAAGLDLFFICICTFVDACDHSSRSYAQGTLMGETTHGAEENGKKCLMIHGFSVSAFQERGFIITPAQETRFVMRSLGVHVPLLEPWKKSPTLWSFALSSYSSVVFYLASCFNHLYLRDPSWEGQRKLAWMKGSNSVILGRREVHVLSSPSIVHPASRWDAQVLSEFLNLVWFQNIQLWKQVAHAPDPKSYANLSSTLGLWFLQYHCPGELSAFGLNLRHSCWIQKSVHNWGHQDPADISSWRVILFISAW